MLNELLPTISVRQSPVNQHQPINIYLYSVKNSYAPKVVLSTGETSGKAVAPVFVEIMNLLIKILTKFGLLKTDLVVPRRHIS
jgi:hypothetical protein